MSQPINFACLSVAILLAFASSYAVAATPAASTKSAAKPAPAKSAAKPTPAKSAAKPAPAPKTGEPLAIELAHQFTDAQQITGLQYLIDRFSETNKDISIKLVERNTNAPPAILNFVVREDVARFVGQKGYLPLHQVMSQAKQSFDTKGFSADLKAGVTDSKGRYKALPLAYSTPVLYYNKTLFNRAGLDINNPPKTWQDIQNASFKLIGSGVTCAYTTSHPAWIHIDNLAARHGEAASNAKNQLIFNGLLEVKHIAKLASWSKSKFMIYFGRGNKADEHFASGECGMLTSNSYLAALWRQRKEKAPIDFGVAPLPYYDDFPGAPQHTLADGASLWVSAGGKPGEYKAVARFIAFLLSPEMQVEFAHRSGFLPLTTAAQSAIKGKLLAEEGAALNTANTELQGKGSNNAFRVSQVGPLRLIIEEELEALWGERKSAKAALDTAVERGTAILKTLPKNAIP